MQYSIRAEWLQRTYSRGTWIEMLEARREKSMGNWEGGGSVSVFIHLMMTSTPIDAYTHTHTKVRVRETNLDSCFVWRLRAWSSIRCKEMSKRRESWSVLVSAVFYVLCWIFSLMLYFETLKLNFNNPVQFAWDCVKFTSSINYWLPVTFPYFIT